MNCVFALLAAVVFVAVQASADPGVHRVTGKYVTHVHKYRIPVSGGGRGGKGGPPEGKGGKGGRGGKCQDGLIKGTAGKLKSGFTKLTSGVAGGLGAKQKKNLVGQLVGGVQTFLDSVAGGLDQATSDFFCGFGRVFDKIGSKVNKGDLIGGLASGLNTFVTGAGSFFGNLGTNALGAITGGVSDAIHGRSQNRKHKH